MTPSEKIPVNNNNNENTSNQNNTDLLPYQINILFDKEVESILKKYPQYKIKFPSIVTFESLLSETLRPIQALEATLNNGTKKIKASEKKELEKLIIYYRLKLVEQFIQHVNTLPENSFKDELVVLLFTYPVAVRQLIQCERELMGKEEYEGSIFVRKLTKLTSKIKSTLATIHSANTLNFYRAEDLKKFSYPDIHIFENNNAQYAHFIEHAFVIDFINKELQPILSGTISRKQIMVFPTQIPDEVFVVDAGMCKDQLILTIITLNNLSSCFLFIQVLLSTLKDSFPNLEFRIVISQGNESHLKMEEMPKQCFELCVNLQKIDLPSLVVAVLQNEIKANDNTAILSDVKTESHIPYQIKSINFAQNLTLTAITKLMCINHQLFSQTDTLACLKPFLINPPSIEAKANAALKEKYSRLGQILETSLSKLPLKKQGYERENYAFNCFQLIVKSLEPELANNVWLYFYNVYKLTKAFFDSIDAIEDPLKLAKKFKEQEKELPAETLKDTQEFNATVFKEVKTLCSDAKFVIEKLSACEKMKRQGRTKILDPELLKLFDYLIQSSNFYLERLYKFANSKYMTHIDIDHRISEYNISNIQCFKSPNIQHLSYPNTEVALDFFMRILMPTLNNPEKPTTQFIIFPTFDFQSSFLLHVSYSQTEQKFYLFFISANNHYAQVEFMCQLQSLLQEHSVKFQIFQYQQQLIQSLELIPQLYLELAKFFKQNPITHVFDLFLNQLLIEKILFDSINANATIPGAILLNPNLFISKDTNANFDWEFRLQMPDNLRAAFFKATSFGFIENTILLIDEYFLSDLDNYEKVVAIANQHYHLPRTALKIAFELGAYGHANILLQYGVDPNDDPNNKGVSVREAFYRFLTPERLQNIRLYPNLCATFEMEILMFEQGLTKEISKLGDSNNNARNDNDSDSEGEVEENASSDSVDMQTKSIITLLEQEAQNILDAKKHYYRRVLKILKEIADKTTENSSLDCNHVYLEKFGEACSTIDYLIKSSKQQEQGEIDSTTSQNLFLLFYFTIRYVNAFLDCVIELDNNQDNIKKIHAHCDKVLNFLGAFEKMQLDIETDKSKYKMDGILEGLLDDYIDQIPTILNEFFTLNFKGFISCKKIVEKINAESLNNIECFKNDDSNQVLYLNNQFTNSFLEKKLMPLQNKGTQSKQILIFPLQQPHLCFLVHVSVVNNKFHLLVISATDFPAQNQFITELTALLRQQNLKFEIMRCHRSFVNDLHLLPSYLFNVAKSLAKHGLAFLFTALQHNLIPEQDRKKIIQDAATICPALLTPVQIDYPGIYSSKRNKSIWQKIDSKEYLSNVLLFKEGYVVSDIDEFKKILKLAKQWNVFHIRETEHPKRSPIQIALQDGYYEHALALITSDADIEEALNYIFDAKKVDPDSLFKVMEQSKNKTPLFYQRFKERLQDERFIAELENSTENQSKPKIKIWHHDTLRHSLMTELQKKLERKSVKQTQEQSKSENKPEESVSNLNCN